MFSNSTSDETVLYLRRKWEVSERVIEPLEMSDTEMLNFFNEYCSSADYDGGNEWRVEIASKAFVGHGFREAVCKAAAYDKEANGV